MPTVVGLGPAKIEVGMIVRARVDVREDYFLGHLWHRAGTQGIVTEVKVLPWPRKGDVLVTVQFECLRTQVSPPVICRSEWLSPVD